MDNNPVKRNENEEPSRFGSLKNEFVDNTAPTEQDSGDGWFKSVGSFLQQTGTDVADVVKDYKAQKGYIAPIDIALTTPYKLFYKNQQEKSKERTAYINQITDNNFQPYDNTFDDKIDNSVMLQSSLGFADTEDEYKKAIQNYLIPMPDGSDREIKIVKDDREDKPLFMPKFYVSVEEDDGGFTPYSNPLQSFTDYAARLIPQTIYNMAAGSTEVGAAAVQGAAASMITAAIPFVGPVLAGPVGVVTFGTSLYTNIVQSERMREDFLKKKIGLTDDEIPTWLGFVDVIKEVQGNHPILNEFRRMGGGEITPTARNAQEKVAAYIGLFATPIARIFDKIGLLGDRLKKDIDIEELDADKLSKQPITAENVYVKGGLNLNLYRQVVKAADDRLMLKNEFSFLNRDFDNFMLATYTPAKFIDKASKLAQQTSTILPTQLKVQGNQLAEVLMQMARIRPDGVARPTALYEDFQKPYKILENAYMRMGDNMKSDYDTLARDIGGLDNFFGMLRIIDAKLKYGKVFDTIGNAPYDITNIQKRVTEILDEKPIAAGTQKKRVTKTKLKEDTALPFRKGDKVAEQVEALEEGPVIRLEIPGLNQSKEFNRVLEQLKLLGKGGQLNIQQARKVHKQFLDENAEFIDPKLADELERKGSISPAKMLHAYAIVLNQMIYGKALAGDNLERVRGQAEGLRKLLLEEIGNPLPTKNLTKENIDEIQPLLTEANKFYAETFALRGGSANRQSDLQRIREAIQFKEDPGLVMNEILGSGPGIPPAKGKISTLKNVKAQIDYIKERSDQLLNDADNFDINSDVFDTRGQVTDTFRKIRRQFQSFLYETLGANIGIKKTSPKDATAFPVFFGKLDKDLKMLMGLSPQREKAFLETAEEMERMFDPDFMKILTKGDPEDPAYDLVEEIFQGKNFDMQIRRLVYPEEGIRLAGIDKEKIRDAILQYMFDPRGNAGVLRYQSTNTAYFDAGKHYVNTEALINIVNKIKNSKVIKKEGIFDDVDELGNPILMKNGQPRDVYNKFFRMSENLAMALEGATKADAGIALSGAQIFSDTIEFYNLYKFIGAITRIALQGRISKLLKDEKTVNFIAGMSEKRAKGFLERAFFGKGALADITAKFALAEPMRLERLDEEEREQEEIQREGAKTRFRSLGTELEQTERLLGR